MGRAFEYRKATKLKRWGNMARVFTKIGKQITMAVKDGGPDPDMNPRLRALIQNAKSENMPKDNIERAIKRASEKEAGDYKEVIYEGYGPFGVAIVVETATDNTTRTVGNIRNYFNKAGGSLGTSGCLSFLFDHKCMFRVKEKEGVDMDELELELIDFGVEEIFAEDGEIVWLILQVLVCGILFLISLRKLKELNEEQQASINKLIEKIEEDDDVQNVFHNMKM